MVYIAYNCIQLALAYFLFPEVSFKLLRLLDTSSDFLQQTYGLSLEEVDAVFETKGVHPVTMSKRIQQVKKDQANVPEM